jgi:hypothetical protein
MELKRKVIQFYPRSVVRHTVKIENPQLTYSFYLFSVIFLHPSHPIGSKTWKTSKIEIKFTWLHEHLILTNSAVFQSAPFTRQNDSRAHTVYTICTNVRKNA